MGYFKIERDFLESEFWLSEPFTPGQAWVDLIGLANYADKDRYYNGKFQKVKRGQVVTSYRTLSERWKWSRGRVSHFIHALEDAKMVNIDKSTKWTTLTIVNYGLYQDASDNKRASKKTSEGQTKDNKKTNEGLQEESKEGKKRKIYIPSRADISAYVSEEGLRADPDAMFDYYESVGWEINGKPIKDWRAVCRRWKQYEEPKAELSQEDQDAELHRLLDIMEKGGNIYDTSGS